MSGGKCPFGKGVAVQLGMQAPGLKTSDPLEAINAGNHAQAIVLLNAKRADGTASQIAILNFSRWHISKTVIPTKHQPSFSNWENDFLMLPAQAGGRIEQGLQGRQPGTVNR